MNNTKIIADMATAVITDKIKQPVSLRNGEESDYKSILQGKATNALSGTSRRRASYNPLNKVGRVSTNEGLQVFFENFNAINLNDPAKKLLDILMIEFTKNVPVKDELNKMTDEERLSVIDKRRKVCITVDHYMESCGLKDKKEARKSLKASLEAIYSLDLEWDEEVYTIPEGKKRRVRETNHFHTRVAGAMGEIKRTGDILFAFNMDFAKYLANAYIMPYPLSLCKTKSKYNPYSYPIGRKLVEHHNMNIGKSNANIISIKSLIDRVQDLPTYEEVMKGKRQVNQRIIEPVERDLDALVETGTLRGWQYTNPSGQPLTENQLVNMTYEVWIELLIYFELAGYPDQTKRLEAMAERKKQSKKKATKTKK